MVHTCLYLLGKHYSPSNWPSITHYLESYNHVTHLFRNVNQTIFSCALTSTSLPSDNVHYTRYSLVPANVPINQTYLSNFLSHFIMIYFSLWETQQWSYLTQHTSLFSFSLVSSTILPHLHRYFLAFSHSVLYSSTKFTSVLRPL